MPNQPKTPIRGFRASDDLWDEAKAIAERRGETLTDVLVKALRNYVRRNR